MGFPPYNRCSINSRSTCVANLPCGALAWRMPTSIARISLYIALPFSAALLILAFCNFARRGRRTGAPQKSHVVAKVTEELQIPNACVGYVIGRGGARVKKLQEDNEVKVFFRDRSETDKEEGEGEGEGESMKIAVIVGKPENVARAKSAIMEVVGERQSKSEPQTLVISVPTRMVGLIIGKQGSQIRQLQYESKARILIDRTSNPNTMQTQVTITGQEADIDRACILLKELLEQIDRRPGSGAMPASSKFSAPPFKPRLLPALLPSGAEPVTVYSSAVDEDCCVWVQVLGPELEELSRMVEEMTGLYPQEGKQLRQPAAGDYCVACFEIDGCWYRARLQCPGEGGKWTVLFVDYGDVGTCLASELKEMRQEHTHMRCQAIKCKLAHIEPSNDSLSFMEALDELSLCAMWKPLQLVVVDARCKPPLISLRGSTEGDESYDIATELVAQGVAMWCATKEEEGEGEEEGEREGRGEEGKEEGEEGETGEDEEAEEEEEKDTDGGDEKEKDTDGGDEKEKDADGGDEEEKDADGGDEEEKETKEEAMQEKSLQPISEQVDGDAVNCVTVERVPTENASVGLTPSTPPAGVAKEQSPQLPGESAAGGGNVSSAYSSSPENIAHSQQSADHAADGISSGTPNSGLT